MGLDLDGSGAIDAEEFLSGCLRLRGPAKALDLALLMREVKQLVRSFNAHRSFMGSLLAESVEQGERRVAQVDANGSSGVAQFPVGPREAASSSPSNGDNRACVTMKPTPDEIASVPPPLPPPPALTQLEPEVERQMQLELLQKEVMNAPKAK